MKKGTKLVLLVAVLAVVIGGAAVAYNLLAPEVETENTLPQAPTTEEGTDATEESYVAGNSFPAPEFTVYDGEGNPVALSDLFGKPIVVNFWASWCGPCQVEMPDFEAAYQQYGGDVHFMMVDLVGGRETVESGMAYIEEKGFTFPVYYDTMQEGAATYGIRSIPTSYFINAQGEVAYGAIGMLSAEQLEEAIALIY